MIRAKGKPFWKQLSEGIVVPTDEMDEGQCSLGHTMALWETVLDRKLEGEVVESALKGSDRCLFRIKLPDDLVERWT